MNVSGLGNVTGSAKALDLFIKCRYLQREHDGRGVYFMTGTPISNTIAEVYTLQRYMQYEELKEKEIDHFDAWASTFGETTTAIELAPGTGRHRCELQAEEPLCQLSECSGTPVHVPHLCRCHHQEGSG